MNWWTAQRNKPYRIAAAVVFAETAAAFVRHMESEGTSLKEKKQGKSASAFGRLMAYAGRFRTLTVPWHQDKKAETSETSFATQ